MNILIFGYNYAPEPTGIGKYTGEMAEWLADRGHDVRVITAPPHYPAWRVEEFYRGKGWWREVLNGVEVLRTPIYVPDGARRTAVQRVALDLSFSLAALRWWIPIVAGRERADVVIAVCPTLQAGVMPHVYRVLRGVPWVFHIQDLQVDAALQLGLFGKWVPRRLLLGVESQILARATVVSTITEAMRRRVAGKGASSTVVFPNWADVDAIRPGPIDNRFRRELGVSPSDLLVVYAGSMGEKQGLELVLDAAQDLRDVPDLHILLVGEGAATARLRDRANEMSLTNVRFKGTVPWSEMQELLAAGDVHLIVQKREAADLVMPSKLLNILAAGRPSLATADVDTELHRALVDNDAGIVTPPGDRPAFTEALRRLKDDGALRRRLGLNARQLAEQKMSKRAVLTDFEAVLLELANKG